jgi:hypothetical protein
VDFVLQSDCLMSPFVLFPVRLILRSAALGVKRVNPEFSVLIEHRGQAVGVRGNL